MIELAVVGQQEQSFRVLIQSPHGERGKMFQVLRHQVHHHWIVIVFRSTQVPLRFVQHKIDKFPVADRFAVDADGIRRLIHLHIRGFGRGAIDGNGAALDQSAHIFAAVRAGFGEKFIQSHHSASFRLFLKTQCSQNTIREKTTSETGISTTAAQGDL